MNGLIWLVGLGWVSVWGWGWGSADITSHHSSGLLASKRYKGSYMNAHVLLNLLNKLGEKAKKCKALPSILLLFL